MADARPPKDLARYDAEIAELNQAGAPAPHICRRAASRPAMRLVLRMAARGATAKPAPPIVSVSSTNLEFRSARVHF